MSEDGRLTTFIKRGEGDVRITPVHMSFFLALFCCWEESGWQVPIRASRRALMKLARIHSTSTYHKCVQELSAFGYIDYKPSFDPSKGSDFKLL
jgi:hypothetical protein